MSLDEQRLADFLQHIADAIDKIMRYTNTLDEEHFLGSDLTQDAVIRNLEVIGEASHNIEVRFPEFAAANPQLPLTIAYQMRNAVAHGYFKVDLSIVWRTVEKELPRLQDQIRAVRLNPDVSV